MSSRVTLTERGRRRLASERRREREGERVQGYKGPSSVVSHRKEAMQVTEVSHGGEVVLIKTQILVSTSSVISTGGR